MNKEKAIAWLRAVEIYFQKLSIMSQEDIEIQSYNQNAFNAKKIADMLEAEIKVPTNA